MNRPVIYIVTAGNKTPYAGPSLLKAAAWFDVYCEASARGLTDFADCEVELLRAPDRGCKETLRAYYPVGK